MLLRIHFHSNFNLIIFNAWEKQKYFKTKIWQLRMNDRRFFNTTIPNIQYNYCSIKYYICCCTVQNKDVWMYSIEMKIDKTVIVFRFKIHKVSDWKSLQFKHNYCIVLFGSKLAVCLHKDLATLLILRIYTSLHLHLFEYLFRFYFSNWKPS